MRAHQQLSVAIGAIVVALSAAPVALPAPQAGAADPGAVRRLLLEAGRREREGDGGGALRDYELIANRFPEAPDAAEALLKLAQGRRRLGDASGAQTAAHRLTERYPDSPHAAGGFYELAELEAARATAASALEESRASFRNVWVLFGRQRFPSLPWRAAALVRSGELALRLGALDEAAGLLVAAIEDEPPGDWTGRAYLGLATVALADDDWLAASQVLQELVDRSRSMLDVSESELRRARNALTLIHRLKLRPAAGQRRWQRVRRLRLELKKPTGLAADPEGRLTVADQGMLQALVVGAEGGVRVRQSYEKLHRPAWGLGGEPLVAVGDGLARPASGRRLKFTDPRKQRQQALAGVLAGEQGVFREWILLTEKPERVLVFAADGSYRGQLTDPRHVEPADLARDALDRLYVLDRRGKRVLRYSSSGALEGSVAASTAWKRPEALAVDLLGNVYVLDRGSRRIEVFDATGTRLATLGPTLPGGTKLANPRDLAVDGGGRLFIADSKLGAVLVLE